VINLLTLKFEICLDNSLNSSHVWIAINVEGSNKLSNIGWILPLFDSFEEAEIYQYDSWSSTDTRGAMYIDGLALFVKHIVEMLGCHK